MNRTSQAVPVVPADPYDALPALPEPVIPAAVVPRWCVQTFPSVGHDSLYMAGFDGEGYPVIAVQMRLDEDRELWEYVIRRSLDARRAKQGQGLEVSPRPSAPSGAPFPSLRLL